MNEAASILGKAIGRLDFSYVLVPSQILESDLRKAGLPDTTAKLIIEMWEGANAGLIVPQEARSARNTTTTSLESFVSEVFAPAYMHAV